MHAVGSPRRLKDRGMSYLLQVKLRERWVTVLDVDARSHVEAFGQAILRLPIEHYDKPVRLEQVELEQSPSEEDRTPFTSGASAASLN